MIPILRNSAYILFLLLIPSSIIRVNAAIPGHERFFLFRLILIAIAVLVGLLFVIDREYVVKKILRLRQQFPILSVFSIWLIWSGLSYFWIVDLDNWFRYVGLLGISIFFVLTLVFFIQDKRELNKIGKIIVGVFFISLILALFELTFGLRLPGSKLLNESRSYLLFVTSFFNHPNDFASYISLTLPFLTLVPILKTYNKYKWFVFITIILAGFILTFTGSKLNYIATLVGIIAALVVFRRERIKDLLAYLPLVVLALFTIFPVLGPDIFTTTSNLFNKKVDKVSLLSISKGTEIQGSLNEFTGNYGSTTVRINLVTNSMDILRENPKSIFVGLGAGQVETYMESYENTGEVTNLHNWWLEIFMNHGIFIIAGYVGIYFLLIKNFTQRLKKQTSDFTKYYLSVSVIILIVSFLTSASPSSSIGFAPLWLTLGLALAAKNLN